MGQPERPALAPFPLLGALAARFAPRPDGAGPYFGTLVARIGLVPNAVLAAEFRALARLAPGRVIAGLGTGDSLSAEENRAYGIPFAPAAVRRAEVVALARELTSEGIIVWVAGGPAGRADEAVARRGPPSTCGTPIPRWSPSGPRVPMPSRSRGPDRPPRALRPRPRRWPSWPVRGPAGSSSAGPSTWSALAEAARAASPDPSSGVPGRQP